MLPNSKKLMGVTSALCLLSLLLSVLLSLHARGRFQQWWQVVALSNIVHEDGHCYFVAFPGVRKGPGRVLENGTALPHGSQAPDEIRTQGRGRYFLDRDRICFAASDNSDPQENRRSYQLARPFPIARFWFGAALALFLISLGILATSGVIHVRQHVLPALQPRMNRYANWLVGELFFLPADARGVCPTAVADVPRRSWPIELICCLGLLALGCVLVFPLLDKNHQFCFEADGQPLVDVSRSIARTLRSGSLSELEPPHSYPPYFDAPFLTYALTSLCWHTLNPNSEASDFVRDKDHLFICSIRCTNALMLVFSGILVFLILRTLRVGYLPALLLGALLFLSPHSLLTDFLRGDHVVLFAMLLATWLTLLLLDNPASTLTNLAWGAAAALVVHTKFTTSTTLFVPLLFILGLPLARGANFYPRLRWALPSFISLSCLFFFRYLLHYRDIAAIFRDRAAEMKQWFSVISCHPRWSYNYDYFLDYGYGGWFLLLSLLSVILVAVRVIKSRDRKEALVLASLVVFSAMGLFQPKMLRWGIHFPAFYLCIIGLGLAEMTRLSSRFLGGSAWLKQTVMGLLCLGALYPPACSLWAAYQSQREASLRRDESVQVTRYEPRAWFKAFAPPGTRVATFGHAWADPPIRDLSYEINDTLLRFPYLSQEKLAQFAPPGEDGRDAEIDIVVMNDFQKKGLLRMLSAPGLEKTNQQWQSYFAKLCNDHPVLRFSHPQGNYGVNSVEIIILSESIARRFAAEPGRFKEYLTQPSRNRRPN